MGTQRCLECCEFKEIGSFYHNKQLNKPYSKCKACVCARNKKWRDEPKNRIRKNEGNKRNHLLRTFGLKWSDYTDMHEDQQGLCMICNKPQSGRKLAVDHNHSTGEVRGLLCDGCNRGLGYFKDNPALLEGAITYLRNKGDYCEE